MSLKVECYSFLAAGLGPGGVKMGPGSGPIGGQMGPKRVQKDSGDHVKSKKTLISLLFEHLLMAATAFGMPQKERQLLVSLLFPAIRCKCND